jgi:phosphatidate cytidylyltransferase
MDANFSMRLATAAVVVPLLVWLVGWGAPELFAAVLFGLTIAALHEFFGLAFPHRPGAQLGGIFFGAALALTIFFESRVSAVPWLGVVFVIASAAYLWMPGELTERLRSLQLTLLGGVYAGFLFPQWFRLFSGPDGRGWTLWLLAVVMAGDSAAYFVGRRFGVRKLAPRISPGKTTAGAWGYLAGSAAIGILAGFMILDHFNWTEILLLSLAVGVLGQLGDLFESWLKRAFAVKDSGNLFPGHGGLLDRIDSLIFPAVVTSAYVRAFHT